MKSLNYLMDHILYQIFNIILNIYLKNMGEKTVNPSIQIYVNKIENTITFKIKTGYYLELLKQWIYLELQKVRQLKKKMLKMFLV